MFFTRRRNRMLGSWGLSLIIHILVGLIIGINLKWPRQPRVIEDTSAIQVSIQPGIAPGPILRNRRTLTLAPPTSQTEQEAAATKRPSERIVEPKPASTRPSPAILESTASAAMVPPSTARTASEVPWTAESPFRASDQPSLPEMRPSSSDSQMRGNRSAIPTRASDPSESGAQADREAASIEEQMHEAIGNVSGHIITGNGTGATDVVFLLDTSGSMYDNILAVSANLSYMVSMFEQHDLDYRVGLVKFKYSAASLRIFPMTTDITKFQRVLANTTRVGGNERAYDAIVESLARLSLRRDADAHFILVTDELLNGSYSASEVWRRCREASVRVNVIGLSDPYHRKLAEVTGGIWLPIPRSPS